jgi:hypothetical protein
MSDVYSDLGFWAFCAIAVRELVTFGKYLLDFARKKRDCVPEAVSVNTGVRDQMTDHERRISRIEGQLGLD